MGDDAGESHVAAPLGSGYGLGQVFGISFTELVLILVVALVVLGPQRLPGMLRTVGLWIHKLRQVTTEVRAQTGIDDLLRQEGFSGGLSELRSLLHGEARSFTRPMDVVTPIAQDDPYTNAYGVNVGFDASRERPLEGPDAYGALADDLFESGAVNQPLVPTSASEVDVRPALGAATASSHAGECEGVSHDGRESSKSASVDAPVTPSGSEHGEP